MIDYRATTEKLTQSLVVADRTISLLIHRIRDLQTKPHSADNTPKKRPFSLLAHLYRQKAWSVETFGPMERTAATIEHIKKELIEIEADPHDVEEWIDVVILALDGAARMGHAPEEIISALQGKQKKNELRKWPDWRKCDPNKSIHHIKD